LHGCRIFTQGRISVSAQVGHDQAVSCREELRNRQPEFAIDWEWVQQNNRRAAACDVETDFGAVAGDSFHAEIIWAQRPDSGPAGRVNRELGESGSYVRRIWIQKHLVGNSSDNGDRAQKKSDEPNRHKNLCLLEGTMPERSNKICAKFADSSQRVLGYATGL
jgi:hypothetical protein